MQINFQIDIALYETILNIHIVNSKKEALEIENEILKNYGDGEQSNEFNAKGRSYEVYIKDNQRYCDIIFIQEFLDLKLLSHEVLHSVFYIMRYIDIIYSEESEEAFTILQGYIVNECIKNNSFGFFPLRERF